jgi:hypothetical protein
MTFDRRSGVLPSGFWRAAIFLAVAAQLLLAFAPLMEGHFGPDARSHVEAAGTKVHHVHNPADCAACAARALQATATHAAAPVLEVRHHTTPRLSERDQHLIRSRESKSRPRAPPLRQA